MKDDGKYIKIGYKKKAALGEDHSPSGQSRNAHRAHWAHSLGYIQRWRRNKRMLLRTTPAEKYCLAGNLQTDSFVKYWLAMNGRKDKGGKWKRIDEGVRYGRNSLCWHSHYNSGISEMAICHTVNCPETMNQGLFYKKGREPRGWLRKRVPKLQETNPTAGGTRS